MSRVLFATLSAAGIIGLAALTWAQAPAASKAEGAAATSKDPGIEFVKIVPGDFVMGCSAGDTDCTGDEKPAHPVKLTKAFEFGKYEVTQAQWQAVMGSNPSTIKGDDHPVETVSKQDVEDFLAKLSARNDGYKYRLPTEAEWEYAARAGSAGTAQPLDQFAWYSDNSEDETHPVGQKKPNAWGLYDMYGNVREWVSDSYGSYTADAVTDPTGPAMRQGGRGTVGRGRGRGGRRGGFRGDPPPDGPDGHPPDGNGPAFQGGPPPDGPPPAADDAGQFQGPGRGPGGFRGGPGGLRGGFGRGGPGGRNLPVVRGGAWDNSAAFVRVSARYHYYGPTLKVSDIGFRVVREPLSN